ncbi:MAG: hypothetical protein B6U85_09305 [Desulfurococcales archaeon ex4484_42]|nr:MAG: hypothetical protein B6U85_09305 [Desulfurococcales archaeon ex4484_42]
MVNLIEWIVNDVGRMFNLKFRLEKVNVVLSKKVEFNFRDEYGEPLRIIIYENSSTIQIGYHWGEFIRALWERFRYCRLLRGIRG